MKGKEKTSEKKAPLENVNKNEKNVGTNSNKLIFVVMPF